RGSSATADGVRQAAVDQARRSANRTGSRANGSRSARTQVGKIQGKADRRIRSGVRNFSGVDAADRAGSRRFVRRDAGAKQVRDRDGGDDQNDRHDDQKFDKRETFLLSHGAPSGAFALKIVKTSGVVMAILLPFAEGLCTKGIPENKPRQFN